METLNIIYSLNIIERYIFKKLLEKNIDFKWKKSPSGFSNFFDSEKGYILNLTSSCLRVTFFENTSKKIVNKIENNIFNIVKSRFNISDFIIEKIYNDHVEIVEV